MNQSIVLLLLAYLFHLDAAFCQPRITPSGVQFELPDKAYTSVSLVGDFNGWSKDETPMSKNASNKWIAARRMQPGIYQYLFFVNQDKHLNDPNNPALVDNYNNSGKNSVFVLTEDGTIELTATPPVPRSNPKDEYPQTPDLSEGVLSDKPVFLNIIWHQHQPLYLNPATDQLEGPWVRTHATKDYFDMAVMLREYPDIHCNINLTSSLLFQLQEYYVKRLRPYVNIKKNSMDVKGFLRAWKGKTDPWIDLMLKPTSDFGNKDREYLFRNAWNAFGISEVQIARFPEYESLKKKLAGKKDEVIFTEQEMREAKFFFYLAHFDPDFLRGAVTLPDGSTCDLSDVVAFRPNEKKFYLKKAITEADCRRMIVEAYKVMKNVIPVHKALRYDAKQRKGQIDIITTPFYHPILPLIYDSDLARSCQPSDALPVRYSYPQDANAQVVKAVNFYKEIFGTQPTGMWPGEGSVAQPVLQVLRNNGVLWTATDVKVLQRSDPENQPNITPYRFNAGSSADGSSQSMAIVFRDTDLSDRIGFKYQNYTGEEAAEDFVRSILMYAPKGNEPDVLITVILDGENAWEWYRQDIDGKEFLNAFYRKLSKLYRTRQVITTTTTEYLTGNPKRNIAPHPVEQLPPMKKLWPGSWINANYDTWIGEAEENAAWGYLLHARQDLERSGLRQPDPNRRLPKKNTGAWYTYMAYEAMYAAEGSDWFWWYGNDQSAPAGDKPFDDAFRLHLNNVYKFAELAGANIKSPGFDPIIVTESNGGQGTMAQSTDELQKVLFTVDVSKQKVVDAIYIVGNLKALGEWIPNFIRMFDDGSHGDKAANDAIWSLELEVPLGMQIQYKFTNSGTRGEWIPGDEFPSDHRVLTIKEKSSSMLITKDTFGKK
jgi:alpha-amylase/alpha-mannosidase (GH57 family)